MFQGSLTTSSELRKIEENRTQYKKAHSVHNMQWVSKLLLVSSNSVLQMFDNFFVVGETKQSASSGEFFFSARDYWYNIKI